MQAGFPCLCPAPAQGCPSPSDGRRRYGKSPDFARKSGRAAHFPCRKATGKQGVASLADRHANGRQAAACRINPTGLP
ncbi:hypothetical protein RHECIAT_CH0001195 [Rhizobium etli CIAT 652]|uniref:Uncharacterized protein n=1 Tax=Rhizobium etli (strain CIAT 652) TaxID=491916 RepID=B3PT10_RHIE6|nr:hypothetical protein RHECIAT_CH0001195 [Rhizobium etli CIAT 652]